MTGLCEAWDVEDSNGSTLEANPGVQPAGIYHGEATT